ncbi:alpha-amylase A-like [Diadema setosum]|uniref:alpha-amylase A-like n=1 Tax=Diadema setosum TaxID=31175 RepID=UPI003B3A4D6F
MADEEPKQAFSHSSSSKPAGNGEPRRKALLLVLLFAAAILSCEQHAKPLADAEESDAANAVPRSKSATLLVDLARSAAGIVHDIREHSIRALNLVRRILSGVTAAVDEQNFEKGRTVIVHLFEWKWSDIAAECERFLGPYGYAGIQVSPPNEHKHIVTEDHFAPWWQRYQPMGYRLNSRSGTEREFRDMVERCNAVGVRIYVDAIVNHMAKHTKDDRYSFPEVPFGIHDFNVPKGRCPSGDGWVSDYYQAENVRNCDLEGLNDLYFGPDNDFHTREVIVGYLNRLLEMGVAGFRIDAAKHMWPADLKDIVDRLKKTIWGTKPYIYQEVIDRTGLEAVRAAEYFDIGSVTEFKYGDEVFGIGTASKAAVWYSGFGEQWGLMPDKKALVFIDNHDNQRNHGGGGNVLTHKTPYEYKKAVAFMLAWDYGVTRVMSSYAFLDSDQGPPSDASGNTHSPTINADTTCGGGWICEHRWRQIRNMACFRNAAKGLPVQNWYDNGRNQIAFSRGSRAFFALNNEPHVLSRTLQTGLPAGVYCDVITGDPTISGCTGHSVVVDSAGLAWLEIYPGEDPMIALHVGAKAGSGGGRCRA